MTIALSIKRDAHYINKDKTRDINLALTVQNGRKVNAGSAHGQLDDTVNLAKMFPFFFHFAEIFTLLFELSELRLYRYAATCE